MNLLGAIGVGLALGHGPRGHRARALAGVSAVPGRFERVEAGQPFLVVVDYAHTPDALERVLDHGAEAPRRRAAASPSSSAAGAIAIAASGRSWARSRPGSPTASWVTSDNPRSEPPEAIIAEIVAGIPAADRARHVARCPTGARRSAPRSRGRARGDVVVIAGKGHETYQIIGAEVLPFDDRAEARAVLEERPS